MNDVAHEISDLLHGYEEIAEYLRITVDKAKHWSRQGRIPTLKMGRSICARRSTIDARFAELEAAARRTAPTDGDQ